MCLTKCIRKIPNPSFRSRTLEPQSSYVTFIKINGWSPKSKRTKAAHHSHFFSFPFAAAEMIRCFVSDTPTPFDKHAHSGLPIKGVTFGYKRHLNQISCFGGHALRSHTLVEAPSKCSLIIVMYFIVK